MPDQPLPMVTKTLRDLLKAMSTGDRETTEACLGLLYGWSNGSDFAASRGAVLDAIRLFAIDARPPTGWPFTRVEPPAGAEIIPDRRH